MTREKEKEKVLLGIGGEEEPLFTFFLKKNLLLIDFDLSFEFSECLVARLDFTILQEYNSVSCFKFYDERVD